MRRALQIRQFNIHKLDLEPEERNQPFNSAPVFLTILDDSQGISDIISPENSEVTEALAKETVKEALLTGQEQGFLSDL